MAGGDFIEFVLKHLPPPPGRVLEVGCGREGGLVGDLVEAGYDATGVDPDAPDGERFVRAAFQTLEPGDTVSRGSVAVVAARVLHHVRPLAEGVERLARLAPLLVVDEFARELIDGRAQVWYEERHRLVLESGAEPPGPPSLDEWRLRHADLHRQDALLDALRSQYEEQTLERVPYLYRWLGDPESRDLEQELTEAGSVPAVGWRLAGSRRDGAHTG